VSSVYTNFYEILSKTSPKSPETLHLVKVNFNILAEISSRNASDALKTFHRALFEITEDEKLMQKAEGIQINVQRYLQCCVLQNQF
jgi:hypothetical protein